METLCSQRQDVYLLIAGDGDMKNEIAARESQHIIPLGRLDFEQIITLLSESDIFCLPSFSEGFSTSILEAAACECYILTTARGGAKELLISDDYGSVIENNEEDILCSELMEVLNHPEKRARAVKMTYERLETNFTWENVANQVEYLCEKQRSI